MDKKILIVDDNHTVRELLQKTFSNAGFSVVSAEDAERALSVLKRESFYVMLLDLHMPGMSGIDLCREIRQTNPLAVIYAMTGYSSLFTLTECREAGFDDYFIKPVETGLFIRAVEEAFEKIERWMKKE